MTTLQPTKPCSAALLWTWERGIHVTGTSEVHNETWLLMSYFFRCAVSGLAFLFCQTALQSRKGDAVFHVQKKFWFEEERQTERNWSVCYLNYGYLNYPYVCSAILFVALKLTNLTDELHRWMSFASILNGTGALGVLLPTVSFVADTTHRLSASVSILHARHCETRTVISLFPAGMFFFCGEITVEPEWWSNDIFCILFSLEEQRETWVK